jgi:hypothetical protein
VSGQARTTSRGYRPSTARRSCRHDPGTIKWAVPRAGSRDTTHLAIYTPHDNDSPRLNCRHLVRHPASFLSLLMPPPACHPILGRGRRHLLPVFVRHQPRHRPKQWLLHVHEDVSQHARTIVFAIVGCPVRLPGLRHVLPPQPVAPAHGCTCEPIDTRRHRYMASQSCSWSFSVCAAEEDTVTPATLRLSWRQGVQV